MSLDLPKMGIGCGSLANSKGEHSFEAMVECARQNGVSYFDTAALYLGGESERRLGAVLKKLSIDDAVISTKIGRYLRPGGNQRVDDIYDYSYSRTMVGVEDALKRLQRDFVDIVFIHDLAYRNVGDRYKELRNQAETGAYRALEELKAQGVIGALGLATMEWETCLDFARMCPLDIIMQAGQYTLLDRNCEALVEFARSEGIAFIAAAPFNSAILATGAVPGAKYNFNDPDERILDRVRQMEDACKEFGVPLVAAALQFPLQHPGVTSVVVGQKRAHEVRNNLQNLELDIPSELFDRLATI